MSGRKGNLDKTRPDTVEIRGAVRGADVLVSMAAGPDGQPGLKPSI